MKNKENGSVLVLAVLFAALLAVSAFTLIGLSSGFGRGHHTLNLKIRAESACRAGLDSIRLATDNSDYDFEGNLFLDRMADLTEARNGAPALTLALDPLSGDKVDLWVYRKGGSPAVGNYFRVVARGAAGGVSAEEVQDVRDRDTFARYLFFVNSDSMPYGSLRFGTTTCQGFVHSNGRIYFSWGNAVFHQEVTAVSGFEFDLGATPANTDFYGGSDPSAAPIALPTYAEITALQPQASGIYRISALNPEYADFGQPSTGRIDRYLEIEFGGGGQSGVPLDTMRIVLRNGAAGAVLKDSGWIPYPAGGLVYVEGDVNSLKGNVFGQVTLAVNGSINIMDDIRYIDQDGDPVYKLVDASGQAISDTPVGTVWGTTDATSGIRYVANPDYNPVVPSVLGLLCRNDIEVRSFPGENYNMEVHAAIFVTDGNFNCSLTNPMGNLRTYGSMVTQFRGWRYNGHTMQGWALSGEYIYDDHLIINPPPHWLRVNVPVWGPVVKVN